MKKLRDRLLLGVVSGMTGVAVKGAVSRVLFRGSFSEAAGPRRAAGMLLPPQKTATPGGKVVGWLADAAVGSLLGILSVYVLSFTGKDKAALKGFTTGALAWVGLYGVLANMGATDIQSSEPRTVLNEFATHTIYGVVASTTAAYLGDQGLFDGGIPWSASSIRASREIYLDAAPSESRH
ncbi:MAG TPA: hypothetical protein GX014_07630 [Firmicutes bacterium]|nr:hypothetical protein [Bacillota bacterium]HHT43253.1 hypothetical protein [Bacillota bacterium]